MVTKKCLHHEQCHLNDSIVVWEIKAMHTETGIVHSVFLKIPQVLEVRCGIDACGSSNKKLILHLAYRYVIENTRVASLDCSASAMLGEVHFAHFPLPESKPFEHLYLE